MSDLDIIKQKYLQNALILFRASFEYLKKLDSPNFDIEFELPSEFEIGLSIENIHYLFEKKIINESTKNAILEFRDYLLAIPDSFWTFEELEVNPIWNVVREHAELILQQLGITSREYDFSIIELR